MQIYSIHKLMELVAKIFFLNVLQRKNLIITFVHKLNPNNTT